MLVDHLKIGCGNTNDNLETSTSHSGTIKQALFSIFQLLATTFVYVVIIPLRHHCIALVTEGQLMWTQ